MPDNPPGNCQSVQITDLRLWVNQICDYLEAHPEVTVIVTRQGRPAAILQAIPKHWWDQVILAPRWYPGQSE